ncbi:MAG: ABC transporter substrate-binding protein [Streptosporangiaceae bacterium]
MHSKRLTGTAAVFGVLAVVAAACGGGGGNTGGGGNAGGGGKPIVVGTTDKVVSFDPAGSYDMGSWTPMWNMYQTLVRFPAGSTTPVPDAAKQCEFTDKTHYKCTLKPNQKFWNGDTMTAKDVVYSFHRNVKIAATTGASSLLAPMKDIKAKDDDTVVFTLKYPFAVFPFVLADPGMAIVDHKVFPANKVMNSGKIVGSGPYKMTKYSPGQQLVLKPNPHYGGDVKLHNSGVIVRYYSKPSSMKLAIEQGEVDVDYRTFSPTDIASLKKEESKGVQVVTGQGAEIQYIVFNLKRMPGDSPQQKTAIRKAVALSVDRASIAKNVYNGTVEPLYSMVPQGLSGHIDAFKPLYGTSPDKAKAKQTLKQAGVKTPVDLTIWWTPSHYGAPSSDMYTNIKRQLEATGLFKVTLKSAEWDQYNEAALSDQYPAFQLGWFPDYPDSDDYVAPFYGTKTMFLNNHYSNDAVDKAISKERASTKQSVRNAAFEKIQKIGAKDAPLIPLWQGKQIAVKRKGVTGVEKTLDPSYTFRYWLIGKK